ncbi:MAG: YibE/F family protein [Lentisphaeria bacterium]|nr:YibE/F family protein [Lentisphaeria bacterium]
MTKHSFRQDLIITLTLAVCCILLWFVPSPKRLTDDRAVKEQAVVLEVDNNDLQKHGLLEYGSQSLKVKLTSGPRKGTVYQAENLIRAQMELDKKFSSGDKIIVAMMPEDDPASAVIRAQDYDRTFWTWLLAGLFCIFLCIFGKWTGVKALFSFFLSVMVIWKAVIPMVLNGFSASWTIFGCVCFLTAAIMFLVAGINRKGVAAFSGAIAGIFAGLCMTHLFTWLMKINGATLPYIQALYHSGYDFLNIQDLFSGAVILASSGAVMDLAMDIASGVEEVAIHNDTLSKKQLTASGMRIGKSVVGTMTTTLLLAYSGGYITLLMMFAVQGNSLFEILNNPLVAAESVKTLIGSFSLVLVAPFTAIFSGILLHKKQVIS